jgi:DNA modification methylase
MELSEIMPTDSEPIKIINADCLDILKQIPDNSIDLVLTDPPYNLDFSKYDSLTDKTGRKFHHTENTTWDLKGNIDMKEISKFLFKEFNRILKETGSIIIFGAQEWAYYYYEPAIKNNFDLKCQLIWIKSNPIPQMRHKNYRSAHENIIWFARYKEEKCPFTFNFINQQEMKNVFEYPILGGVERIRNENNNAEHPTQKPLKLIHKLIKVHSNPNDLVLDCFLGSGTTAVACKQLGRKCIGIEISPEYCKIAKNRLCQEVLKV